MASSLNGPAQTTTTQLADAIKLLVEKLTPKEKPQAAPLTGLQQAGAALSAVAGAAGAVVGAVQQVVSETQQFVQALQPGLVAQFGQAIKDVQATIGVAFTGIFDQGITFLRQLAGQIGPVFAALKPAIDQMVGTSLRAFSAVVQALVPVAAALVPVLQAVAVVGEAVGSILRPVIAVLGTGFQLALFPVIAALQVLTAVLSPIIAVAGAVLDGLALIVQTYADLFRVFTETLGAGIASLLGLSGVGDIVKAVKDAFAQLRSAVILTAARLALLVGATGFVDRQIKALTATGESAAGTTSIKGLEQIGKDLALASVNAAGSATESDATNADLLKELRTMREEAARNNDTSTSRIVRAIGGDRAGDAARETGRFFDEAPGWAKTAASIATFGIVR